MKMIDQLKDLKRRAIFESLKSNKGDSAKDIARVVCDFISVVIQQQKLIEGLLEKQKVTETRLKILEKAATTKSTGR